MSEEVTPVFDVVTALIVGIVLLVVLFTVMYCNEYKGSICPGRWVYLLLGQKIYDSIDSLILKAIMSQILRLADFIPR